MLHIFASISAWYSDKQSEKMRAVYAARPAKYKAQTLVLSTFANTFVFPKRPFQHVNHKRMYTAPAETRTLTKTWSVVARAVFCFARGPRAQRSVGADQGCREENAPNRGGRARE